VTHRARNRERIGGRAGDHEHVPNDAATRDDVPLAVGNVELFLDHAGDAVVTLIGDDTDDIDPRISWIADANATAHRVAVLPVRLRHRFVDDRDELRVAVLT